MMASKRGLAVLNGLLRSPAPSSSFLAAPLLRPYPRLPRTLQPAQAARRYAHQIPKPGRPSPPAAQDNAASEAAKPRKLLEPHYELTFTCVPCTTRSTHTISKQGYHKGSVLITCPSCRNRHIISDHLNIFGDRKLTIEDLMREKGQLVKRGTLGVDGDIEFWEDGTQTARAPKNSAADGPEDTPESEPSNVARELATDHDPNSPAIAEATTLPSNTATTTSTLQSNHSRPQVHDAAAVKTTPSTKRPIHTQDSSKNKVPSDPFKINDDLLLELRSELRSRTRRPTKPEGISAGPVRKVLQPFRKFKVGGDKGLPSDPLSALPLPPCKIPINDIRMLERAVRMAPRGSIRPIGIPAAPQFDHDPLSATLENEKQPNTPSARDAPLPLRKELSTIRSNVNGPEAQEFAGLAGATVNQDGRVSRSNTLSPISKLSGSHRQDSPPSSSIVRFVKSSNQFKKTEHDGPSSFAEGAENDHRSFVEESWARMYHSRRHRMPQQRTREQRTRTVYAWPDGATEPVAVQVAVRAKPLPSNEVAEKIDAASSDQPKQLPLGVPIKPPQSRKVTPKKVQKVWDKHAPYNPDGFAAEMGSGPQKKMSQRPLPEELYEQYIQNVESAKQLEKQKVTLDDFDIYDLGTQNHRI